ncbi:MAG: reverse transcriptase domain-containing protein [Methylococcales bacterium]
MANSLEIALSKVNLDIVWRYEKSRLLKSSYGIDRKSGFDFQEKLSLEFFELRQKAKNSFKPKGLLAVAQPKPNGSGNRIICIPTISDRMLQFALLNELRPNLANRGLLNSVSYGLMRDANRTVQDAREKGLLFRKSLPWVYKTDIEKFFDNVPRATVREAVKRVVSKRSLHNVVMSFIDTEIEDGFDSNWQQIVKNAGIENGKGIRQGMPLSPYFAGMILLDLDEKIQKSGVAAIRYIDDIAAFFQTRQQCIQFDKFLREELAHIGLEIGPIGAEGSKTTIYNPDEAALFLGLEMTKQDSGDYQLLIPQRCIQKVGAKFATMGSVDKLLQKQITLPKLGGFLDAMEAGYTQAYKCADNINELTSELKNMKKAALNGVLEEALGEQFKNLAPKIRKFLGVTK